MKFPRNTCAFITSLFATVIEVWKRGSTGPGIAEERTNSAVQIHPHGPARRISSIVLVSRSN